MRWCALFILLAGAVVPLTAQFSAYGSVSAGTHSNPLYNYLQEPDRLLQHYLDLSYGRESEEGTLSLRYSGGSMVFSKFSARTYYEHRMNAVFTLPDAGATDEEENEVGLTQETQKEFGPRWSFEAALAGRFDTKEFKEFDNTGVIGTVEHLIAGGTENALRIRSLAEYRVFPSLRPFTNIVEITSLQYEHGSPHEGQMGVRIGAGWKYYPRMRYDTSLFEPVRSYVVTMVLDSQQTGNGKNKPWVYFTYPDTNASDKFVMKDPKTKSTYQVMGGVFYRKEGDDWSLRVEAIYRLNSHSDLLTMVQNTSDRTLNEDLYNTEFAAQGPELHVEVKCTLPGNVRCSTVLEADHKVFETPAYDLLSGEISAGGRIDDRLGVDLETARYFPFTPSFGMDVTVSASVLRNRSNDPYNNFTLRSVMLTVGFGV